eukprot:TRINITY_DN95246_c0_g1_i1.p1 TRINITY_DN95246_c0_g1~~TRINITY_DN95246_c0_g1_i1.p1  ORF type:complete len:120 (-),score=21.30 TRINITY_DN95246_c0_g1_i1:186-545(-)
MARSTILPVLMLALATTFLLGQVFVNPASEPKDPEARTALRAAKFGQPGFGGFGSVSGDASPSPVRSSGSSFSAPSPSPSSSSTGGAGVVANPNQYIIGITVFFFACVYANDQGFFGPW